MAPHGLTFGEHFVEITTIDCNKHYPAFLMSFLIINSTTWFHLLKMSIANNSVFSFEIKKLTLRVNDFSTGTALQTTCGNLLQRRGLCLDLRKTLLIRNPG